MDALKSSSTTFRNISGSQEVLLFSDGMAGLSHEKKVGALKKPLFVINSSSLTNTILFKKLIPANGKIINLRNTGVEEASKEYYQKSFSLNKMVSGNCYPINPGPFSNMFTAAGILSSSKTLDTLRFLLSEEILRNYSVSYNSKDAVSGELARAFFAQKKLVGLLIGGGDSGVKKHGLKYKMVTPFTSLIVLDSVMQYATYKIEPPGSLPEMKKKYFSMISKKSVTAPRTIGRITQEALNSWNSYQEWYKTKFGFPAEFVWSRKVWPIPDHFSFGLLEVVENKNAGGLDGVAGLGGRRKGSIFRFNRVRCNWRFRWRTWA